MPVLVFIHDHFFAILAHSRFDSNTGSTCARVSVYLDMEWLCCVNSVLTTGPKVFAFELVDAVQTFTRAVTGFVVFRFSRRIVAFVGGGLESPLVCLHEVKLRTVVSSCSVAVAVVVAVTRVKLTVLFPAGHADSIERAHTATTEV